MKSVLKSIFFYHVEPCARPLTDIYETDEELVIEADLPGVNTEDVSVKVYEDLLIIEGIRREICEETNLKYFCMERDFKEFRRVLKLPAPVNTMAGEAFYIGGVLTVRFPKLRGKVIRITIERK